jgi:hypothetical protein
MAADLCSILFPVDFSNRCVLAPRHVKTWAEKLSAILNTLHVVDPNSLDTQMNGTTTLFPTWSLGAPRT